MSATPAQLKRALFAWADYDAALTVAVHNGQHIGWQAKPDPKMDRLYERALVFMRVALDLPMGALGESELSPVEVAALVDEARRP